MTSSNTRSSSSPQVHLTAGAVSGLVNCVLLQPLDLLKTRLQQPASPPASCRPPTMISTVRSIYHQEGPLGLWRGTWPTIVRNTPGSALYFAALNGSRQVMMRACGVDAVDQLPPSFNMLAGSASRVAVGWVLMPFTVLKARYESDLYKEYRGMRTAFVDIWRREGGRTLFAGFGATALRDAPYAGLYLAMYERGKRWLKYDDNGDRRRQQRYGWLPSSSVVVNSTSALVSGFLATVLTHPFDVLRLRIQLQPQIYRNAWTAVPLIYRQDNGGGWRGFMVGLTPRLLRKTLSAVVVWSIYEEVVSMLSLVISDDDHEARRQRQSGYALKR
jgi:solute carrier family 25, member 38